MAFNFIPRVLITIDEETFSNEFYDIDFNILRDLNSYNTGARININNLSKSTKAKLLTKTASMISIMAGYKSSDIGLIFQGYIRQTKKNKNLGVELYCDEGTGELIGNIIERSYSPGTSLKEIVKNVIEISGFKFNNIECDDYIFERGYNVKGSIFDILDDLSNVVNARFYIKMGILYFVKKDYSDNEIEISSATGLISIQDSEDDFFSSYKIEMQLNNLIRGGDILSIKNHEGEIVKKMVETVSHIYRKDKFISIIECGEIITSEEGRDDG